MKILQMLILQLASLDDRRITNGYCINLGNNLTSWCSKKQFNCCYSCNIEVEYLSLALATNILGRCLQTQYMEVRITFFKATGLPQILTFRSVSHYFIVVDIYPFLWTMPSVVHLVCSLLRLARGDRLSFLLSISCTHRDRHSLPQRLYSNGKSTNWHLDKISR